MNLTEQEKAAIDQEVSDAFAMLSDMRHVSTKEASLLSAKVARRVYAATRPLGLKRHTFADAPPHKPTSSPLNAFARRYFGGLLGETLPGYPFDKYSRAKVAGAKPKAKRAKIANVACPHCGGSLKEAA